MPPKGPFEPGSATKFIRSKVTDALDLRLTGHAKDQMLERGLIVGDVLHVLKFGTVFDKAQESTQMGLYKYKMQCTTPNSNGRGVAVVVIPGGANELKIVTVMWVD